MKYHAFVAIFSLYCSGISASAQLVVNAFAGGASEEGMPAASSHVFVTESASCLDGTIVLRTLSRIYAVTNDGLLLVLAGKGETGVLGDGSPARDAQVFGTGAVTCDALGNVYFADGNRLRKVSVDGVMSTVAGTGLGWYGPQNGPALSIATGIINGIVTDTDGSVYYSSGEDVSVVRTNGFVSHVAGHPRDGGAVAGDGGEAARAILTSPKQVGVDGAHNLYVADVRAVRKVSPNGIITTVLGGVELGSNTIAPSTDATKLRLFSTITSLQVLPSGEMFVGVGLETLLRVTPDGKAFPARAPDTSLTSTPISFIDSTGNIYYGRRVLYKLDTDGQVSVFAGGATYEFPDGTLATEAAFTPSAIAVDSVGMLVFFDGVSCKIRRIDLSGKLETIAGAGGCEYPAADGLDPRTSKLPPSIGIALARDGAIVLGSAGVYRIDAALTKLTKIIRSNAYSIGVDSKSNVYFMDDSSVNKFDSNGRTYVVIGRGSNPRFQSPTAFTIDQSNDTVYVFDQSQIVWAIPNGQTDSPGNISGTAAGVRLATVDSKGVRWGVMAGGLLRWPGANPAVIGRCCVGDSGDGGPEQSADLGVNRIASGFNGDKFFTTNFTNRIRRISGGLPQKSPTISAGGVVSAANYSSTSFASYQIVTIFGDSLAYDTRVSSLAKNHLTSGLGSTAVVVDGSTVPVLSVSPTQINALLHLRNLA